MYQHCETTLFGINLSSVANLIPTKRALFDEAVDFYGDKHRVYITHCQRDFDDAWGIYKVALAWSRAFCLKMIDCCDDAKIRIINNASVGMAALLAERDTIIRISGSSGIRHELSDLKWRIDNYNKGKFQADWIETYLGEVEKEKADCFRAEKNLIYLCDCFAAIVENRKPEKVLGLFKRAQEVEYDIEIRKRVLGFFVDNCSELIREIKPYFNDPKKKGNRLPGMPFMLFEQNLVQEYAYDDSAFVEDLDYGISVNKPIMVNSIPSEERYLKWFNETIGNDYSWNRLGSTSTVGIERPIDIYRGSYACLSENTEDIIIYICPYGTLRKYVLPKAFRNMKKENEEKKETELQEFINNMYDDSAFIEDLDYGVTATKPVRTRNTIATNWYLNWLGQRIGTDYKWSKVNSQVVETIKHEVDCYEGKSDSFADIKLYICEYGEDTSAVIPKALQSIEKKSVTESPKDVSTKK